MTTAVRSALPGVVLSLALALGATSCSDDSAPSADPGQETSGQELPTGEPPVFEVATRATIGRVVGRLPRKNQDRLVAAVSDVVQRWFNAAYGGSYPRSDFGDAFPGFTAGAEREAKRDKQLLTNIGIGDRVTSVTPTESRVWLDVLAVRKHAAAVTARFRLAFRTEGKVERKVRVRGRLMLTKQDAGWRIFAYDVSKGATS